LSARHQADRDRLAAAVAETKSLGLLETAWSVSEDSEDVYAVIERLARRFDGRDIVQAERALKTWDDVVTRAVTHPNDPPAPGPRAIPRLGIFDLPTDAACAKYTPFMDAAYYLGLAMGARLARTLGLDEELAGAR
jgi:hypothetical protein